MEKNYSAIIKIQFQIVIKKIEYLLDACQSAWVFGGMGSWNDIWIEDENILNEYKIVSNNLYSSLISTIIQSVNSVIQRITHNTGSQPTGSQAACGTTHCQTDTPVGVPGKKEFQGLDEEAIQRNIFSASQAC